MLAFLLATMNSTCCVDESTSLRIERREWMAKKFDGILIEVKSGPVSSVGVDGELASCGTDLKTTPAQREKGLQR